MKFIFSFSLIVFLWVFSFISSFRITNNRKKIIHLAYALDNKISKYPYVSISSLLENRSKNSFYYIYLLVPGGYPDSRKKVFYKLEEIYFSCKIYFFDMGDLYRGVVTSYLSSAAYYRLKLHELLPDLNRIIYIDGDTIILKDLSELYDLDFKGKYLLGRLDMITNELDRLGKRTNTYINSGVILLDLYHLRKYGYTQKFNEYLSRHNNRRYLNHHDQTLLNYVLIDKIGLLAPKFHMWNYFSDEEALQNNHKFRLPYNDSEFIKDFHDPTIVHFPGFDKRNSRRIRKGYEILWEKYIESAKKMYYEYVKTN